MELVHITATYSNALLVAILPHVSDFAGKMDLPILQPVTVEHVARFNPSQYQGRLEGALWLTNGYWFFFGHHGYVESFRSPDNFFFERDPAANFTKYLGHTSMTTNEIVSFARERLLRFGYPNSVTHADAEPDLISGPYTLTNGHIPCCRVVWEPVKDVDAAGYSKIRLEINTQERRLVGLYLFFAPTNQIGTPLKLDVEPELESEFRQRSKMTLFYRSNAPARPPPAAQP